MPNPALDPRFGRALTDVGRFDGIHGDEDLVEDETHSDRVADYRRAIPYCGDLMKEMAERLWDEGGALEVLMNIAFDDPHAAGLHLTAMANILRDQMAEERADQDRGEAQELIASIDRDRLETQVEMFKAALRKG